MFHTFSILSITHVFSLLARYLSMVIPSFEDFRTNYSRYHGTVCYCVITNMHLGFSMKSHILWPFSIAMWQITRAGVANVFHWNSLYHGTFPGTSHFEHWFPTIHHFYQSFCTYYQSLWITNTHSPLFTMINH